LIYVFRNSGGSNYDIYVGLKMTKEYVRYYLDKLKEKKMISESGSYYFITPTGREYVIERGLVTR
jgi:predicted transcriptional regulator